MEDKRITFGPGPLGIKFEWSGGLRIQDFEDSKNINTKEERKLNTKEKILKLRRGDILSSVNGVDIQTLTFAEVVQLLRSAEKTERVLEFSASTSKNKIKKMKNIGNSVDKHTKVDNVNNKIDMNESLELSKLRQVMSHSRQNSPHLSQNNDNNLHMKCDPKSLANATSSSISNETKIDDSDEHKYEHEYEHEHDQDHDNHLEHTSGFEVRAPVHSDMIRVLNSSSKLKSLFVDIKNESYWYDQRRQIGPKKHLALPVKQHNLSGKWESYIYKMKPREEDFEMVPQRSFCSSHKSRWAAIRHAERCCRERDANPAANPATATQYRPEDVLATHFKIKIVSEVFDRQSYTERVGIVMLELLDKLGVPVQATYGSGSSSDVSSLGHCAPTKSKIASHYGMNVCQLPIFKHWLPSTNHQSAPLHLVVECLTPSQWKPGIYPAPDSERFGKDHAYLSSSNVPKPALGKEQAKRVKLLTAKEDGLVTMATVNGTKKSHNQPHTHSHNNHDSPSHSRAGSPNMHHSKCTPSRQSTASEIPMSPEQRMAEEEEVVEKERQVLAEALGLPSIVSGINFHKKVGGIYGHFFRDLPPSIKERVMEGFVAGKKLIQKEGFRKPEPPEDKKKKKVDTFKPKTTISQLRKKVHDAESMAPYDKGTESPEQMLEEVMIHAKKSERMAIRMQRIWRSREVYKKLKWRWHREYATLVIQKRLRGIFGRRFAKLLRKLRPIAATRIQRLFHNVKSRVVRRKWMRVVRHLSRRVLPKMKRFLRNCYLSWLVRHKAAAIIIQRCMRKYVFKERLFYLYGWKYLGWRPDQAATEIQRHIRGVWARRLIPPMLEAKLVKLVDHPAANCIQRIFRGTKGRIIATEKRRKLKACLIIQRLIRRFLIRCWEIRHAYAMLLERSATAIQKVYRGRLDRELYQFRYRHWWYHEKYIPAVILVQSYGRMFVCQRDYLTIKRENNAATFIQLQYWASIARAEMKRRWAEARLRVRHQNAAQIQKIVRAFLSRKLFSRMQITDVGKRMLAAKTILRAWVTYRDSKRFEYLFDEHRTNIWKGKLVKIAEARLKVENDKEEIISDKEQAYIQLDRCRSRIKELDTFHIEADQRLARLDEEIEACTPEDRVRGWEEAFLNEYNCMNAMREHCLQELRLWRHQVIKRNREILEFNLEIEECEVEIEELTILEIEAMEKLRRWEIERIERKLDERHKRDIRMERYKWKIRGNRAAVIRSHRTNNQHVRDAAESERGIGYATTVTYEKRAQHWDYEDMVVSRFEKEEGLKLEAGMVRKYEDYGAPIQESFDNVVSNTLTLLKSWTVDERARRIKQEMQAAASKKKKAQMGQFQWLKPEYEPKSAFDYLDEKK